MKYLDLSCWYCAHYHGKGELCGVEMPDPGSSCPDVCNCTHGDYEPNTQRAAQTQAVGQESARPSGDDIRLSLNRKTHDG